MPSIRLSLEYEPLQSKWSLLSIFSISYFRRWNQFVASMAGYDAFTPLFEKEI